MIRLIVSGETYYDEDGYLVESDHCIAVDCVDLRAFIVNWLKVGRRVFAVEVSNACPASLLKWLRNRVMVVKEL
jgi:hypothetical protein